MVSRQRLRADAYASIEDAAAAAGFELDPAQAAVRDRLLDMGEGLLARGFRRSRPRSLYVFGDSGRGKSWLLNAFFHALPTLQKRRVHFHGFFDRLHLQIHEHQGEEDAVERAVGELTDGVRLLYFDEFHVHDSGDATLLIRLLRRLFASDVVLLASSNYAPESLLPNPVWHHIFQPGIDLILQNMGTVELIGGNDYRTVRPSARDGFGSGEWISPGTSIQLARHGLLPPEPDEATDLAVRKRQFAVAAARPDELWTTFAQACEAATSSIEYLQWARSFERWIITGMPSFDVADPEAQQRFINLVDILCDQDMPLFVTSDHSLEDFSTTAANRPDAFRMLSRLQLLACDVADVRRG